MWCDGKGHVFADSDPIEGYKLAPIHKCLFCGGSGEITIQQALRVSAQGKKALDKARESARTKLTVDEYELLKLKI